MPTPPSDLNAHLDAIVRPLATATYTATYPWNSIEKMLIETQRDYGLDLNPDYQRGHVWTDQQQAHFIENVMRSVVPRSGLQIQFNCPHWENSDYSGDLPRTMSILDGLQRLTAIRGYLAGRVKPFGMSIDQFADSGYDTHKYWSRWNIEMGVHTFRSRRDLLRHYLGINAGGTPHATAEIERVRGLLKEAS